MIKMNIAVLGFTFVTAASASAQVSGWREVDLDPNMSLSELVADVQAHSKKVVLHIDQLILLPEGEKAVYIQNGAPVPLTEDGKLRLKVEYPLCRFIAPDPNSKDEVYISGFSMNLYHAEKDEDQVQEIANVLGNSTRLHDFIFGGAPSRAPFNQFWCTKFTAVDVLTADMTVGELIKEVFLGKASLKEFVRDPAH